MFICDYCPVSRPTVATVKDGWGGGGDSRRPTSGKAKKWPFFCFLGTLMMNCQTRKVGQKKKIKCRLYWRQTGERDMCGRVKHSLFPSP